MTLGRLLILVLTVTLGWLLPRLVAAQTRVEKDEEVRVMYLQDWYDGLVIDTESRKALVEFEFGGQTRQEVFERPAIRKMCEVDAMDFCRNWKSAGGKFTITAALKSVQGNSVTLIKPDLEELEVDLEKLSKRDQSYVSKLVKSNEEMVLSGAVPAKTPALPPLENYGSALGSNSRFGASNSKLRPLGQAPSYLSGFNQAGVGFNMSRKTQELVAIIPVGGPEQWVLMTARDENTFTKKDRFQSQLYWVSLRDRKAVETAVITATHFPLDYDPITSLLLTFDRKETFQDTAEPDHYTLWETVPGTKEALPVARWEGPGMGWAEDLFAKIISDRIVLTKSKKQEYVAYDLQAKKVAYTIRASSFFDAPVQLTQDRRHLLVPEDGNLSVFDAVSGELEFSVDVKERHCSGAALNAVGTRLAGVTERNIYVWDLESPGSDPVIYPAPLIGSPFACRIEWVDDDHLLVNTFDSRVLYRLSLSLPVWTYKMELSQYWLNRDPLKNMVVDGLFFYVAKPDPFDSSIAVGAIRLPGPSVAETTKDIKREDLDILKPGVKVSVDASGTDNPSQVQAWMEGKARECGWVVGAGADIVIKCSMGVGETQSVVYEPIDGRGPSQTVSFTPHFASLQIVQADTIIWQTGTSTGAPPVIYGVAAQAQVNLMQRPRISFFRDVKLEPRVIDPKYSRGFGVSQLGLRGIQVVSTTPPGREDDPNQAAADAEADRNKAGQERQGNSNTGGGR